MKNRVVQVVVQNDLFGSFEPDTENSKEDFVQPGSLTPRAERKNPERVFSPQAGPRAKKPTPEEARSNLISVEFERTAAERLPNPENPPWGWLALAFNDDFEGGSPHLAEAISRADAQLARPDLDPVPYWNHD